MKKLKICEYCQNEFNPKESHSQLYCSSQCLYQGKRRKTLETNRKRYGCDVPSQNSQIKQKVKSYFVEKFGVENPFQNQDIKEKIRLSNLEKYGVEQVQKSQVVREKTRRTCIQKYGGNSPMASSYVKNKIKQTNIERYGVQNVFANEDIKKKIRETNLQRYGNASSLYGTQVRKKVIATWNTKYGVNNPFCIPSVRLKCIKSITKISKLQLCIKSLLLQNHIEFQQQFPILPYFYDFRIGKLLIEVNGDYWHANPLFYQQNQEINYPRMGKKLAKQIWAKDKEKYQCAIKLGYKVIYLWQNQIKSMNSQQLIKQIRKYL